MQPTTEQIREIARWGHQHRRLLREKYRCQFVAYGASQLIAASRNWQEVEAIASAQPEPYLIKWIPACTSEFQFFQDPPRCTSTPGSGSRLRSIQ